MKKLFTAFLFLFVLNIVVGTNAFAQTQAKVYDLQERFTTDVSNWGFTLNNGGTQTVAYESATYRSLQIRWPNSNSEYIKTLSTTVTQGTDNLVTVEMIIKAYTCGSSSNYGALYLMDDAGNAITGFHVRRGKPDGVTNKWFVGRASSYPGTTTYSYPTSVDPLNADQPLCRIVFVLDFSAKTLSFTAEQGTFDTNTRVFTASGASVASTSQAFINTAATNIKSLRSWYFRGASASGTNGFDLMYAGISALRNVATVTVNYLDPSNTPIKTARVAADAVVGSTYSAAIDDKASFVSAGNYYAYDAASTTADNVVVLADGTAQINLKFTKSVALTGNYTWTGSSSANWNETETNFTTDGSNAMGYQFGNAVVFNAAGANKSVVLNNAFDLGANDVTISGDGYSIAGAGKITGTGKVVLNTTGSETATLNLTNELTGGVQVNGGIVVLSKDAAASKLTVADGVTLNLSTGANFSKGIAATGTLNIIPTSNVSYSSAIAGGTTLNYNLVSAGSVSTSAFSALPTLNNTFSGDISVSTSLASALLGTTVSYASNKLNLGDNISLVYPVNPAADGSTTIAIGQLTGSSLAKLMGNRIGRVVTYKVGELNTDFTFAGTIENYGPDQWAGIPVINLTKAGTGTMTLSGNSSAYVNGTVVVSAGKLAVNGTLGTTAVPVTVNAEGTLAGTGTIGGATTVNGILDYAGMTFSKTLTLAGTTKMSVSSLTDSYLKVTGATVCGGTLEVNFSGLTPVIGDKVQLFNATNLPTGAFTTVTVNNGLTWDLSKLYTDGYIEAVTVTKVANTSINIVAKKYYSLTGTEVEATTEGTLVEKVIYEDGSVVINKIVNRNR